MVWVSLHDTVSRSACVIVWEPVHTIVAPGAKVATGIDGVQLKPASAGYFFTVTLCCVVLHSFPTRRSSDLTWPTWSYLAGFRSSVFVRESVADVEALIVSSRPAEATALLKAQRDLKYRLPPSACVIGWERVDTIVARGAKVPTGIDVVQLKQASVGVFDTVTLSCVV